MTKQNQSPDLQTQIHEGIQRAEEIFAQADCPVLPTLLERDNGLSEEYDAEIWLASELHQVVGSYKIRGAWNFAQQASQAELQDGLVTTSAGNHSRAVALAAANLQVPARVFMPETTPELKVQKTQSTGGRFVEVELVGETFDDAEAAARNYLEKNGGLYLPPFDDPMVISGQGTLGSEIFRSLPQTDVLVAPVGGGGLISGCAVAAKAHNTEVEIYGAEPAGAASMQHSLEQGQPLALAHIDTTVDGAAVKKPGELTYSLTSQLVKGVVPIDNYDLRRTATSLWERSEPVEAEMAGCLAVAALEQLSQRIAGKTVVCLVTGGSLSQERYYSEVRLPVLAPEYLSEAA